MDLTRYLLKLAPDFSVLDLAEKYLYCDSKEKWNAGSTIDGVKWNTNLIVDKLFFAIKKTTSDSIAYNIPFKRVLIRTTLSNGEITNLIFPKNYIVEYLNNNHCIVISDSNSIKYRCDLNNVEIVGVGF